MTFNECAAHDAANTILEEYVIPSTLMAPIIEEALQSGGQSDELAAHDTHGGFRPAPPTEERTPMEEAFRWLDLGASVEDVYIDLLAPAARKLGDLWATDECDFVDVTMGVWRLQEVMRAVSMRSPPSPATAGRPRRALFCPIPGEAHSFGAQMIDEVFARAGWTSDVLLNPKRRDLLNYLSRYPVDLIGLTVTRDCPVSALKSLVKAIRNASLKSNLCVLIGGRMIDKNPSLSNDIGANGTARDARAALRLAETLVPPAPAITRALS
ncbi:MAG: cobalamin B12-binding protein [Pseudomonadota bacterium]